MAPTAAPERIDKIVNAFPAAPERIDKIVNAFPAAPERIDEIVNAFPAVRIRLCDLNMRISDSETGVGWRGARDCSVYCR